MRLGYLALRTTVGAFFVGHGTQKLFGWFGGHGLDATAQAFENMGLRPGRANAIAAGAAEAGGGALLATGLANPFAATVLTATMLTAIRRVHAKNGPWLTNGGYEYNVVLIAAALALAPPRAASPSSEERRSDSAWALAALLAGLAGAATVELAAGRTAPAAGASAAPASAAPAPGAAQSGDERESASPASDVDAASRVDS